MATIGRHRAVAFIGRWHFGGYLAWLMWLVVHLMNIVEFQNRLLVLIQWAWNYVTWNRSARLITYARNLGADRGSLRDHQNWEEAPQPTDRVGANPHCATSQSSGKVA